MIRLAANLGVRWCRSLPAGLGSPGPGGAHNSTVPAAQDPPAALLEPACLQVEKSPFGLPFSSTFELRHGARLCVPDAGRILGNGSVTGEFSRAGNIQDRLPRPSRRVGVELAKPLVSLEVGFEIGQMHVVVSARQKCGP